MSEKDPWVSFYNVGVSVPWCASMCVCIPCKCAMKTKTKKIAVAVVERSDQSNGSRSSLAAPLDGQPTLPKIFTIGPALVRIGPAHSIGFVASDARGEAARLADHAELAAWRETGLLASSNSRWASAVLVECRLLHLPVGWSTRS